MTASKPIKVARLSTGQSHLFETEAEALRFIHRRGDQSELWRVVPADWRDER